MKSGSMLFVSLLTLASASLAVADWPNFRGPNGDSAVAPKADLSSLSAASVKEVWKAPLGDSFGQVSVAGDKVFAFIKRDEGESVIALDAASGKELWATHIDKTIKDGQGGDGPRTTPAIDGKFVYIYSTYQLLFCLDAATGKEVWKHDIVKEAGGRIPGWGNAASPVVVGDNVIVVGGGKDKGIMGFDKTTGKLAWAGTSEKHTHATPTVATILGTQQVICFMQSGLVSVDPKTGTVLWTFAHPYSTSTAASPVVGGKNGDVVYCSAGYNVGAAACRVTHEGDKWSTKELWNTPKKNMNHWSTPVHYNGYIYGLFGHNDSKGPLACLDIETGDVKWSEKNFGTQGGLIRVGDKLLIHTVNGELVLVAASPDKYTELGRDKIFSGKNWTMPDYSDGKVFARNTEEVVCLDLLAK